MKLAVCYKGFFLIKSIKRGESENLSFAKKIINNHKQMLLSSFVNDNVDFYFSTYKISENMDKLYQEEFFPKSYTYISNDFLINNCGWTAQIQHYKNLISKIKESKTCYDFFIFTRPDIKFFEKFTDMNIKNNFFNIIHHHPSGNCDDNFWFFPNKFFIAFENAIDRLSYYGKITHEINHELINESVPINYISSPFDRSCELGHKIFEICR